jgi:hypothetical protein
VISLADFQYSGECMASFQTWRETTTKSGDANCLHVLVILVDVTSVTSAAVNFAVHKCDEGNQNKNCLYVLMLHFPAETAFLGMTKMIFFSWLVEKVGWVGFG